MNEVLNQIKSLDIVSVISQYISLSKKGANYTAPCPFHDEKTGSFTVSPSKGIYKCFGCGKGGDVIEFVIEYQNTNFMEAVKEIAQSNNIDFDIKKFKDSPEADDRFQKSQNMMKKVLDYYNDKREEAEAYLKKRGLSEKTMEHFQIGISKPGVYNLIAKEDHQLASDLSLLSMKEGTAHDFLINRVTYPFHSVNGTLLGFGGRALQHDKDTKWPKWINPKESFLYNKSKTLYGLFQAKTAIRKFNQVIITEGAADVWTAYEYGMENVVATNGTALTDDHAQVLKGFCDKIYLAFDNDKAGQEAAEKAFMKLIRVGFDKIEMVLMDEGMDLSDYLNSKKKKKS